MSRVLPRNLAVLLATAPLIASCYSFAQPSFHPGNARQVVSAISRRGVDVVSATAGDAACDDPGLVPNSTHLRASVDSDPTVRDVWIYIFREKSWAASAAAVDACQAAYEAANPGAIITRIDIPTYRAFGAGWSAELADSVRGGLKEASEQGEPP